MPVTTKKQIYVFDSGLPDLQVLIDAAGPDAQIITPRLSQRRHPATGKGAAV